LGVIEGQRNAVIDKFTEFDLSNHKPARFVGHTKNMMYSDKATG